MMMIPNWMESYSKFHGSGHHQSDDKLHQFSLDLKNSRAAKAHEFTLVIPHTFETLLVLHHKAAQTSTAQLQQKNTLN